MHLYAFIKKFTGKNHPWLSNTSEQNAKFIEKLCVTGVRTPSEWQRNKVDFIQQCQQGLDTIQNEITALEQGNVVSWLQGVAYPSEKLLKNGYFKQRLLPLGSLQKIIISSLSPKIQQELKNQTKRLRIEYDVDGLDKGGLLQFKFTLHLENATRKSSELLGTVLADTSELGDVKIISLLNDYLHQSVYLQPGYLTPSDAEKTEVCQFCFECKGLLALTRFKTLCFTGDPKFSPSAALIQAVFNNNKDAAIAALNAGADINALETSTDHYTPLQLAITHQNKDLAEFLVNIPGTDFTRRTTGASSLTVLEMAMKAGYNDLAIKILQNHGGNAYNNFTYGYSFDVTKLICEYLLALDGVNLIANPFATPIDFNAVNLTETKLNQLLAHMFACTGNVEALKLLISRGELDVNYIQPQGLHGAGDSLLGTAARAGHLHVVKLLVENGADINQVQGDGISDPRRNAKTEFSKQIDPSNGHLLELIKYFNTQIQRRKPEHKWLDQDITEVSDKSFKDNEVFKRVLEHKSVEDIPEPKDLSTINKTIFIELSETNIAGIYKLFVSMQDGSRKKHVVTTTLQNGSEAIQLTGIGGISVSIDANNTLLVENYVGANPLHISTSGKLTVKNLTSQSCISLNANGDVQTLGNLTARGSIQISTPENIEITSETKAYEIYVKSKSININAECGAARNINVLVKEDCQVNANLKAHGFINVKAANIAVSETTALESMKDTFLVAQNDLSILGKIISESNIGIYAAKNINYSLFKLQANKLVELKIPKVANFQFPENIVLQDGEERKIKPDMEIGSAVSYELIGDDPTPITIPGDILFSKELRIKAPQNELIVGSQEKLARVSAINKILLNVKKINVFNGTLFACDVLSLKSVEDIRVGNIDFESKPSFGQYCKYLPSCIASEDLLLVNAGRKIEVHCGEVLCRTGDAWFSSIEMDTLGGELSVYKDSHFDVNKIFHGVIHNEVPSGLGTLVTLPTKEGFATQGYIQHGVHVKTPAAIFAGYGAVNLIPGLAASIVGGLFYVGKLIGLAPIKVQNIRQSTVMQLRHWSGHKKERKCWWDYDSRLVTTGERDFPGRVVTMAELSIDESAQFTRSTGDIIAGQISAKVKAIELGVSDHHVRVSPVAFKSLTSLEENESPSYLYIVAPPGSKTYMQPAVPMRDIKIKRPEHVVILQGKMYSGDELDIPFRRDAAREIQKIFPKLMKSLGDVNFSGQNLEPDEVWFKLQQNGHEWLQKNPQFKDGITRAQLENVMEPMIIYEMVEKVRDGKVTEVLDLMLVLPKHLANLKLLSNAGGWFAKIIKVEGTSLKLYGFMQAREKLLINLTDELILEKHQYHEDLVVTEMESRRNLLTKQTRHIAKSVTNIINQIGAEISGGEVAIKVGWLESNGGEMFATDGNVEIIAADSINLDTADGIYYTEHTASGRTFLKRIKITEQLERHIIDTSKICASGDVLLVVEAGNLTDTAAKVVGKNVSIVVKAGDRISKCKVVAEDQGTSFSKVAGKGKMMLTETHVITERGIGSMFVAEEKLAQQAAGKLELTGASQIANEILLKADKGIRILPQVLNNYIVNRTVGMGNAFTAIDSKTEIKVQQALQPVLAGFTKLDVDARQDVIEFMSAKIKGKDRSKFIAKAKEGSVKFTTMKLETSSKTTTKSVGVSFTGSQAIAAAIEGNVGESLKRLTGEVPLFAPLIALAEGGHSEDMMAQAMLGLFTGYREYKNGTFSGGFSDYVFSQFGMQRGADGKLKFDASSLQVSLRLGIDVKTEDSTQVLASTISAWDMVFQAARDVDLNSVHIDGKTLKINAGGSAHIVADASKYSARTLGRGVSAGYSGAATAGVDANTSSSSSTTYHASMINVVDRIDIKTGENVEVRGSLLSTAKACIFAKNFLVETLLDEERQRSVSASVGIAGDVGLKTSRSHAKWANMQSGIHASETLYINATGEVKLKGGVLEVGNKLSPLRTASGDELYELQMPNDGDDLFHALGVSRIKAAKDLLENKDNEQVKTLVVNDMVRLFKAGQLPQIIANNTDAVRLIAEFNALASEATPRTALEEKIRHYCSRTAIYESFVAFYVGVEGSNLTINCANANEHGTIDAIAQINKIALKTWIKDTDGTLKLHHEHNPNEDAFEVNLFANVVDNDGANRISYNLLSTDPQLVVTPVVTFEHLRGYKKGSGFGVQASGLYGGADSKPGEDKNKIPNSYVMPTMSRSKQVQMNMASVTGDARFVNREGEDHDLDEAERSGTTQVVGKKHSEGGVVLVPASKRFYDSLSGSAQERALIADEMLPAENSDVTEDELQHETQEKHAVASDDEIVESKPAVTKSVVKKSAAATDTKDKETSKKDTKPGTTWRDDDSGIDFYDKPVDAEGLKILGGMLYGVFNGAVKLIGHANQFFADGEEFNEAYNPNTLSADNQAKIDAHHAKLMARREEYKKLGKAAQYVSENPQKAVVIGAIKIGEKVFNAVEDSKREPFGASAELGEFLFDVRVGVSAIIAIPKTTASVMSVMRGRAKEGRVVAPASSTSAASVPRARSPLMFSQKGKSPDTELLHAYPKLPSDPKKLTKGQIVEYLQSVDKVPLEQLTKDLNRLGFELVEYRPERNIYKFSHPIKEQRGTGKAKSDLGSSKVMVEIHCDAISGPHMHIKDVHGDVYGKDLKNLTSKLREDNPDWHPRKLKRKVDRLPEAHISIKEFVELNMRPSYE